jgi:SAM-dependent methyltransferase
MRKKIKLVLQKIFRIPVITYILRQFIVKKYIRLNNAAEKGETAVTPWVCEFSFDVKRGLEYLNQVFNEYFKFSGLQPEDIVGKRILEVGPGENFGVALRFLAAGALQVVCTDRFDSLVEPSKQLQIYKAMMKQFNQQELRRLETIIEINEDNFKINTDKLKYINLPIEELQLQFAADSFDFVVSRAVLEHVFEIKRAMEVMDHLLKPEGYMLHEVDFRDHGIFTEYLLPPLTFLTLDEKTWHKMTSQLGAPNRKMVSFFEQFFRDHNYKLETNYVLFFNNQERRAITSFSEKDFDLTSLRNTRKRLSEPYRNLPDKDLLVAASFFSAQKK